MCACSVCAAAEGPLCGHSGSVHILTKKQRNKNTKGKKAKQLQRKRGEPLTFNLATLLSNLLPYVQSCYLTFIPILLPCFHPCYICRYIDTDVVVLRPFASITNVIGYQEVQGEALLPVPVGDIVRVLCCTTPLLFNGGSLRCHPFIVR